MSDAMNSRIFAKKWLEREGLFEQDSDYDGYLGTATMQIVELIASQGHSGHSMFRIISLLDAIYKAYGDDKHAIWQEYWQSEEGQALKQQHMGAGNGTST